jgi:hypothetical protein
MYAQVVRMTSVQSFYQQRDNRLIDVSLTGFIKENGEISGLFDLYQPAIATLDVTDSRLFMFDTRDLVLRDTGVAYLVGIEFNEIQPPKFYPGFEINIIINVKDTNIGTPVPMIIRIQKNPAIPLEYGNEETYIEVNNADYLDTTDVLSVYTYGHRTITLLSTGEYWVVKSSYLNNGPSSVFM